jgi:regulator of CtrA degradation
MSLEARIQRTLETCQTHIYFKKRMADEFKKTIRIADRITNSASFDVLYSEGMRLVEETASYLDGPGRQEAKELPRIASVLYAAESMRLTTRLMQVASWLLLQRAVKSGEMTRDQVLSEKTKVRLDVFSCDRSASGWSDLPERFRDYVERSIRLQTRVALLDREIYHRREPDNADSNAADNLVRAQQDLLQTAFGNL